MAITGLPPSRPDLPELMPPRFRELRAQWKADRRKRRLHEAWEVLRGLLGLAAAIFAIWLLFALMDSHDRHVIRAHAVQCYSDYSGRDLQWCLSHPD